MILRKECVQIETLIDSMENYDVIVYSRYFFVIDGWDCHHLEHPTKRGKRITHQIDEHGTNGSRIIGCTKSHPGTKWMGNLNPIVEEIGIINGTDYIVVMNMDRIRYSHPVKEMIGKVSQGDDEKAAFAEHIYFSKAEGEIGTFIRAFVPIKDADLNQIGVVVVGNKIPTFLEIMMNLSKDILFIVILTLLFGLLGSVMLANHIKKQMFQLEPYEIKRMHEERIATFHAMNEGVIAIDSKEIVTIFNEKAKKIFNVKGKFVGQPIRTVLEDTRLPEIVERNQAVYNEVIKVSGKVILSTRIPIRKDDELIGAVAIFQDRTEVTKLAEELTGVKNFVEALRVQSHEHMNQASYNSRLDPTWKT